MGEFFKSNWKKIALTIFILTFTAFLFYKSQNTGLTKIPLIILYTMIFPMFFFGMFGVIGLLIGLILNILWLYLISCILIALFGVIKNKINWTKKKLIILCSIILIGILVYGFFNLGMSDVFVKAADDKGATIEGVKEVVNANNQFSIDLYSRIKNDSEGNIFFSPWSISNAMAMVYEGARGETAEEIKDVFYFPEEDSLRRSSYANMLNTINKGGGEYQLSTANAIWLQEDYPFLQDYKDTIDRYYLGKANTLDFVNNPDQASSEINNWVTKKTNNKIKKITSPDMFNPSTRAVLTNAIYFKGKWEHQFDKDDTEQRDFTLESGQKVKVPMMQLRDDEIEFNYYESDGIQILEMPYKGDKISMLVLLPRTETSESEYWPYDFESIEENASLSNITQLESILSEEKLQEWRSKMEPRTVFIYLPKYHFETTYSLDNYLKSMGMNLPFTWPGADFSGIDGTDMLYIDKVLHKAYIDVYEEGTEAAAATMISMTIGAAMPNFIEFKADHPFIFIIQEKETGNILFMGKVIDPR
ncbi:MAG: serpin family protein [Nanobdellota archaeon]